MEAPAIEDISARYIGVLKFSKSGLSKIVSILERDYAECEGKGWMQSGKTIRQAYMTDLLEALIRDGESVRAVHFSNGWIEFDTNEDYETALEWVKDGTLSKFIEID